MPSKPEAPQKCDECGEIRADVRHVENHRVVRDDSNGAKKLESVWLGRAADMKQDALAAITKQIAA